MSAELAELVARQGWRRPAALAGTGDAELDRAVAALEAVEPDAGAALAHLAASRHADPAGALLDVMSQEASALAPPDWQPVRALAISKELLAEAFAYHGRLRDTWARRSRMVALAVVLLEARADDALRERLLERAAGPGPAEVRNALAASLLGWRWQPGRFPPLHGMVRSVDALAPPRLLDALAAHLEAGDPLVAWAAVAVIALDPAGAPARIGAAVAVAGAAMLAAIGAQVVPLVDLDRQPGWVDVLGPMLRDPLVRLTLHNRLVEAQTSAPLLAALPHAIDDSVFADLLDALRRVDDPCSAPALEALAATLPAAAKKSKLARTADFVRALVKRLARKRKTVDRASLRELAGVGTDGGPVLVLDAEAAAAWAGVPDYEEACAAVEEGRAAFLEVHRVRALVLPSQHCGFAPLDKGRALLILAGTTLAVAEALAERGAFAKLRPRLEVGPAGLALLDAAFTLAGAPEGASATVPLAAGRYGVEEACLETAGGTVHAVRLTPMPGRQ